LSYSVAVVTRNGAPHITATLDSLLLQTEKASTIAVVDDGSTDETPSILERYEKLNENVRALTKPDRGYDIRRVPANINLAWKHTANLKTRYFMISGDDCEYTTNYARTLIARLDSNPLLMVASGRPSMGLHEHSPAGSGRIIRTTFWRDVGGQYPLQAGWETWLLGKAEQNGFRVQLFDDLVYKHARPRGTGHQFVYWGAAMGTLGYHPLYVMGRIGKNLLSHSVPAKGAVNMLRGFLQAELGSDDPFIAPFDESFRRFVNRTQKSRITKIAGTLLSRGTS
jgi:hypothetical protein